MRYILVRIGMVALAVTMGNMTLYAQEKSFAVTLDQLANGSIQLSPALPPDGKYPGGTKVTVTAMPETGYAFDSGYYSVPGRWGAMFRAGIKLDHALLILGSLLFKLNLQAGILSILNQPALTVKLLSSRE